MIDFINFYRRGKNGETALTIAALQVEFTKFDPIFKKKIAIFNFPKLDPIFKKTLLSANLV